MAEPSIDLAAAIERDHQLIERQFAQYESGMTGASYEELVTTAVQALTQHAAAEEQVVYPIVRVELGDDDADRSLGEHQRMKDLLAAIEGADRMGDTTPAFTELMAEVRHHVPAEEAELLPRLRRALGEERMLELGAAFQRVAASAPSPGADRGATDPPETEVQSR